MVERMEKVTLTENGFKVGGNLHKTVNVTFQGASIKVFAPIDPGGDLYTNEQIDELRNAYFGFYEYYELSKHIARCIGANWERPPEKKRDFLEDWLEPWLVGNWGRKIGKGVHAAWKTSLARVDERTLAAHRMQFVATMGCAHFAKAETLFTRPRNEFIVRDITKYRSAAIALYWIKELETVRRQRAIDSSPEAQSIMDDWEKLNERAKSYGLAMGEKPKLDVELTGWPWAAEAMDDWRGLFSPDGKSYKSLDRTLMNLPGNIPHETICSLKDIRLTRPYTNRLELMTLLIAVRNPGRWDGRWTNRNLPVFERSNVSQIREAVRRVAEHTRNSWGHRRYGDVCKVVCFLQDYPEEHTGNIVGLADKSIAWHREQRDANVEEQIEYLGRGTKTAIPTIALPKADGIKFLDTVDAVCYEGKEMAHCLASYAGDAVRGDFYLFSIEHNGERATAQIGARSGKVVQIHGPANRGNKAVVYGRKVLRKWARALPVAA